MRLVFSLVCASVVAGCTPTELPRRAALVPEPDVGPNARVAPPPAGAPGARVVVAPNVAPVAVAPAPHDAPAATPPPRFAAAAEPSRDGWNVAQIQWLTFDQGVAAARSTHKPMCLVLSTTWCPHCRNYSHIFEDPDVVAAARDFVMVRADADAERALSQRFAPDGAYVPRTYFLSPNGDLVPDVKAHEGQFAYFYSEHAPSSILDGMRRARLAVR